MSTVVLVGSDDVDGSLGRSGYLDTHLRRKEGVGRTVDVLRVPGGRCDVIGQRLASEGAPTQIDVPSGLESWYSSTVAPVDVPETAALFVISMADAVVGDVWRHRSEGILVQVPPDGEETWSDDEKAWLHESFEPVPPTDDEMTRALRSIADQLASAACELLVFNVSTVIPGEKVYWFRPDDPETMSERAARANLVIDRLARELGLALVDVDRVTAELGAGVAVIGPVSYSTETLEALAEEAMAMILDLEGISRVFASDAMRLAVPRYDRRTTEATLTKWHVGEGLEIDKGDALFDLRFENLQFRLNDRDRETGRTMRLTVVAARGGYVADVSTDVGTTVAVGDTVGVVLSAPEIEWDDIDHAVLFPVGFRLGDRDDE